jgi:putative ABC transport system substrate-binding protein
MRRRDFIAGLGSAVAWPLGARAQQGSRVRGVGVLMQTAADDPEGQARLAAFLQGLQEANWALGGNVRIDYRWAAGDDDKFRRYAAELVALAPDVILASTNQGVRALQQQTRTIPIVFAAVVDPVGEGFIDNLARPGSNATGFELYQFPLGGKWLELLKQIAPRVTRVAVLRITSRGDLRVGALGAMQAAAPSFGLELSPFDIREAGEIERTVTSFARGPNGGLIVPAAPLAALHRNLIVSLADHYHLPAVYSVRYYVASGGLISYGSDPVDQFRRAAGYVDRILKGEKPADLPVQAPTKYETVINLKTAKALGLTIRETLLATADEVIQ